MRFILRSAAVLAALSLSGVAAAHVTVWPKDSTARAYERYSVRVPNEKEADTVAVELRVPDGVRVEAVEQKPGWTAVLARNASGIVTTVRWTGKLAPHEFTELGLIAVNPASAADLVWPAVQTYADGTTVEWTGPAGSATPAPHTAVKAAPEAQAHAH